MSPKAHIYLLMLLMLICESHGYQNVSDNQGLILRITQKGLDHVGNVAVNFIHQKLEGLTLPDVSDDVANMDMYITNLNIVSFPVAEPILEVLPRRGLQLILSNIEPVLEANYQADIGMGFFTITKKGKIKIRVKNMRIRLEFLFSDKPSPPNPFTVDHTCESDGDIYIDFEGQWSGLLHAGSRLFKSLLDNTVADEICNEAAKEIDKSMKSLPLKQNMSDEIVMDLTFTKIPTFGEGFLETYHKGEIEYNGIPMTTKSQQISPLSFPPHTDNMGYLSTSEAMVNDWVKALFRSGQLEYTVTERTRDHIPDDILSALDLSCDTVSMCVDELISNASLLVIPIAVSRPPEITFLGHNTVGVNVEAVSRVEVDLEGDKMLLLNVFVNVNVQARLTVKRQQLFADVHFDHIQAKTDLTLIPLPNVLGITTAITDSISAVVVAQIKLLKKQFINGVPIPAMDLFELINTNLIPTNTTGVMVTATDLDINLDELLRLISIKI